MKQIFLKVYPNGKTSTNATVLNFDREHNSCEIVIDYSEVSHTDWIKQLDLVFSDETHTFVEGTGNTLTIPLLESYLKKGTMTVQPLAKRLVGETYEKVKWQVVALSVRDSLNVLENDTSITPSIAEQWEIRIDAVEEAELVRVSNEETRIENEDERISNEQGRVSAESTRVAQENARKVYENYNPLTPYVVGNKVSYNGSSYVCILNSTGNLPTNSTYWLLIASKGNKGNQWRGAYSGATSYVVDDVVSYNGSSYICILASLNNIPTNTTYWSLFAQKGDNTTASAVTNTPSGNISATTVQGAINELDTEKADKLFATNLVTNGDFSNGTTGWIIENASVVISSNKMRLTTTTVPPRVSQSISFISGRKYLIKLKAQKISGTFTRISQTAQNSSITDNATNITDTSEQTITFIATPTITGTTLLRLCYPSLNVSVGDVFDFWYPIVIDLTAIFGAGNEPTKEQMDWLLAQKFTNSWFNGTQELTSITDLLTLVNTKADKSQEAWITPTLLNGVTGTARYRKNDFGQTEIYTNLTCVDGLSNGTNVFILPVGYRPGSYFHAFLTRYVDTGGVVNTRIQSGGEVQVLSPISAGHRISFYATFIALG